MNELPWFRLYAEMVDDPKLKLLAFEDRWHFVALLCLKCQGILDKELELMHMRRLVAVKLGVDMRTLDEIERRLVAEHLIERDSLQPLQWDRRQFRSDRSADRTRAWREREREKQTSAGDVTAARRHGDGLDTDAEYLDASASKSAARKPAKVVKHEYTPEFEQAWAAYPKRPGMNKLETFKAWKARLAAGRSVESMLSGVRAYAAYSRATRTDPQYIKQPATFFGPHEHFLQDWSVPISGVPKAGGRAEQRAATIAGLTNTGENDDRHGDCIDVSARHVG